jgi:hypothetical protein
MGTVTAGTFSPSPGAVASEHGPLVTVDARDPDGAWALGALAERLGNKRTPAAREQAIELTARVARYAPPLPAPDKPTAPPEPTTVPARPAGLQTPAPQGPHGRPPGWRARTLTSVPRATALPALSS